jgi:hypothetical protein
MFVSTRATLRAVRVSFNEQLSALKYVETGGSTKRGVQRNIETGGVTKKGGTAKTPSGKTRTVHCLILAGGQACHGIPIKYLFFQ